MNKEKVKTLSEIAIILFFFGLIAFLVGKPLIQFVSEPVKFREWMTNKGLLGPIAFVGMVALQVIIAVIPGEPLEIGAGYAFGTFWGTILTLIGITIGSVIIFLAVKKWGLKIVRVFFTEDQINSIKWLHDPKKLYTFSIILFLIPGTPKDLITYFAGLTEMKMLPFLLIVNIARLPSVITSTIGGNAIGTQHYYFAIIIFAVTAIIAIIGIFIYRRINGGPEDTKNK